VADYFEAAARASGNAKARLELGDDEVLRKLKEERPAAPGLTRLPRRLAGLVRLVDAGTISGKMAKEVFEQCGRRARRPPRSWSARAHAAVDESALAAVVAEVVAGSPSRRRATAAGRWRPSAGSWAR